jgi:hypothetical protein
MIDGNAIPIGVDIISAQPGGGRSSLRTFNSYSFERNIMTPAAAFRFAAPAPTREERLAIRSGDQVEFYCTGPQNNKIQIGTGFIDDTDTHVTPAGVEYSISGRDTAGQLVDNDAIDTNNAIVFVKEITLIDIANRLLNGTRLSRSAFVDNGTPNGILRYQSNVGETKMNALQRYTEYCNCLVWSLPTGQLVVGKPNMSQSSSGNLTLSYTSPGGNNLLEARVKRNTNQAIRRLAVQIQALAVVDPTSITMANQEPDVKIVAPNGVGMSKYMVYSLGSGLDAVNTLTQVGTDIEGNNSIGRAYARRHLAMENVKVIDVECVVIGHLNDKNVPYNIDQVYSVFIEDEDLKENLFVYSVPQVGK